MNTQITLPTLDQIANALPKAQTPLLDAIVANESREALIARGAEIKSSRILTDGARIYGLAYAVWSKATSEQKDALVGFSPDLLALGVDRALALQALTSDSGDAEHVDAATVEERAVTARLAFARGLSRRNHAVRVLRNVVGRDATLRARVDAATGKAANANALGAGLERLATLGRELLSSADPILKAGVQLARLDDVYLARLDSFAAEVKRTAQAARVRATAARAAQGEIDFLDGVNLDLLERVINAFEGAHAIDPSIPRLVPIATRRLLGKRRRKVEEASPERATETARSN